MRSGLSIKSKPTRIRLFRSSKRHLRLSRKGKTKRRPKDSGNWLRLKLKDRDRKLKNWLDKKLKKRES